MKKVTFWQEILYILSKYDLIDCDLVFELLRFKIHLNLRTDSDFENFYARCQYRLVNKANNSFIRIKYKCFSQMIFDDVVLEFKKETLINNVRLYRILKDSYYIFTMFVILLVLAPYIMLILLDRWYKRP